MEGYTEVFAWGGDHFGQLGLGNKHSGKTYSSPRFCSFNILIKELACGEEHSVFISASGHVYSMGSNSEGRLGLGDKSLRSSPSPCLVEGLISFRCVKVSCGWGHSAVTTEDGNIFTWGVGEFGALGTGSSENAWSPVKALIPRSMRGLEVNCGSRHTAAIVEENRNKIVIVSGSGEAGQLGTGKREKEFSFVAVKIPEDVLMAACGVFHTLVLGVSGKVYATGGNSFGQLGLGNKKSYSKFERVQIEGYIVKVAAGNHSAAITDKGQLFIWGTGVFGEYLIPTRMGVGNIKDIGIGGSFGVALDVNGIVCAWGANANGELGNGDFEPKIAPSPIAGLKGKTVKKISCGGNYVLALGLDLANENRHDSTFNLELDYSNLPKKTEISRVDKYRTSSVEVEKQRNNEFEVRRTYLKDQEAFSAQKENEKLSLSYKLLSQKFEDSKLEIARLNEKNIQMRNQSQRLQRELDDMRRASELAHKESFSSNHLKASLDESQRQNLILTQELKAYKDEVHRVQRALEESKLSSKLEISHQYEEMNYSMNQKHYTDLQEAKINYDQEVIRRRQLEKNLEVSAKHIGSLEDALNKTSVECSDARRLLQDRSREYESYKSSLQQEIEKYYKENNELKRKFDSTLTEKQRTEVIMRSELNNFTNDCSELQMKLDKLSLEKEKVSVLYKTESEKHQQEATEYRRRIEILTIEKEKTVKNLQTEIYNLGVEMDNLRVHLERISAENQNMSHLLGQKGVEVKHYDEDIAALKTEISYYKQANDELKYQIGKLQHQGSENVHKLDVVKNDLVEWEENYKMILNENTVLKDTVAELENKNRQLFDNLEKELAQRAKEYKERTIMMLNTPNRSTSPYLRPTTPMTHTRDKSDDMGNAAAKLLDVMDSPKSVRTSQYLTISQAFKGSTTPTKEDVRVRIASLMRNRSRIEEQIQNLNHE